MKCLKSIFILLIMTVGALMVGCVNDEPVDDGEPLEKIKVLLPSGAPLMSIGNLIGNEAFEFEFASDASALGAALIKEDYDMVIAPLNLGAKQYLAGKSNYKLASVLTTNNTYLVSLNEVNSITDLAGLGVLAYGQNSTPDIIFRAALAKHNVTLGNLTYQANVGNVLSMFQGGSSEATYSLLAEPQVTILKKIYPNLYVLDIASQLEEGAVYPQACLYVKANSEIDYNEHLTLIKENVNYLNTKPAEYAASVEEKHTYFKTMTKSVLEEALPKCNIVYLEGKTNKEVINTYITLLNTYAPAILGGKVVDDAFYY